MRYEVSFFVCTGLATAATSATPQMRSICMTSDLMQAYFFCCHSESQRGISWKGINTKGRVKLSPSVKQVPLSPFPRKRAPRRLPPAGGTSRSRSAKAFPDCVTRFRGGALRHAKFPKTSYKVQLLDTLKHAACVSLNHRRRRGLIFLSSKVLAPFKQNASVLSGDEVPSRFLAV